MAKLKVGAREWHFRLELEPGEVESRKKKYTSRLVYQPQFARITVRATGDGKAGFAAANMRGPRVTANGLSFEVSEEIYRLEDAPGWLEAYIRLAVQMAQIELDRVNGG